MHLIAILAAAFGIAVGIACGAYAIVELVRLAVEARQARKGRS